MADRSDKLWAEIAHAMPIQRRDGRPLVWSRRARMADAAWEVAMEPLEKDGRRPFPFARLGIALLLSLLSIGIMVAAWVLISPGAAAFAAAAAMALWASGYIEAGMEDEP